MRIENGIELNSVLSSSVVGLRLMKSSSVVAMMSASKEGIGIVVTDGWKERNQSVSMRKVENERSDPFKQAKTSSSNLLDDEIGEDFLWTIEWTMEISNNDFSTASAGGSSPSG